MCVELEQLSPSISLTLVDRCVLVLCCVVTLGCMVAARIYTESRWAGRER